MLFRTIVNSTKLLFLYLLIQPPSPKIKIPQNSNVNSNINDLKTSFQEAILEPIYDACVDKGSTPASKSLSDIIKGINNISTGSIDVSRSDIINSTVTSFTYTPKYKVSYVILYRSNANTIEIKSITGGSFSKLLQYEIFTFYEITATNNGGSPITMSFKRSGGYSDCSVLAFY